MKTRVFSIAAGLLLVAGLFSCKPSKTTFLPPCTGKPGEVVLVISDDLYKGAAGDSLAKILRTDEPALPGTGMEGAEPLFDLVRIPPSAFNNLIRPARNILIIEVDPKIEKAEIKAFKDYWADEQVLVRMYAPNRDQFITFLNENRNTLVELFRDGEIDRQVAYNKKYQNIELGRKVLQNHEIITSFPKGFEIRLDTGNFVWIHYDPTDMIQGILLWSYPYSSKSQVDYAGLIAYTDQHLKYRVPGPSTGSYMAIDLDSPVISRTFTSNGNYVRELKGLWGTVGAFMGGPFISWSFVDEKRNRIVTAFAYVYAPKINKRNLVRKMESLLKTISFPD